MRKLSSIFLFVWEGGEEVKEDKKERERGMGISISVWKNRKFGFFSSCYNIPKC